MQDWEAHLGRGDFSRARESWRKEFAGLPETRYATWALAGIEERWGDSLFFRGEPGAAEHYHAARQALVPTGMQFALAEENDRRMAAHGRVMNKLYAIDPFGLPRPNHGGEPHPDSVIATPAPRLAPPPEAPQALPAADWRTSPLAHLFRHSGHWSHYGLGVKWREAGDALAARSAEAARRAYDWSLFHFERYNQEWSAHLPASRWDSDGVQEMEQVRRLAGALFAECGAEPLPVWVHDLLEGDWERASAGAQDIPGLESLAAILTAARQDAR